MASRAPRPRVGLALGSGSARGWAHIGIIEGLAEAGIVPDVVCGASIGALVGAAQVTGQLDALSRWAIDFDRLDIIRLIDLKLANGGLVSGKRLVKSLTRLQDEARMEILTPRFGCVATDLTSGQEVWLTEGDMLDAVHASMALPGLFAPVRHGERWLVDGGIVNPVPVSLCRALGAERVIAVNLNSGQVARRRTRRSHRAAGGRTGRAMIELLAGRLPPGSSLAELLLKAQPQTLTENFPKYLDVLMGSIYIMQDYITRSRMAGDPPDLVLAPRLQQINLLEFNRAEEAIAEGRACIARMRPLLDDLLGG